MNLLDVDALEIVSQTYVLPTLQALNWSVAAKIFCWKKWFLRRLWRLLGNWRYN